MISGCFRPVGSAARALHYQYDTSIWWPSNLSVNQCKHVFSESGSWCDKLWFTLVIIRPLHWPAMDLDCQSRLIYFYDWHSVWYASLTSGVWDDFSLVVAWSTMNFHIGGMGVSPITFSILPCDSYVENSLCCVTIHRFAQNLWVLLLLYKPVYNHYNCLITTCQ